MRYLVRPLRDPDSALDLTDAVVEAIARQLAAACGGNAVLNRLEAAAHLESLLRRAASMTEDSHGFALSPAQGVAPAQPHEEDLHATIDTGAADRERQPQGFAVQRLALERAG